ncbi:MAG TPA: TolC family protein, partial [Candidatus Hydrogenedentes bacterium]|nr:TolC family protein [Candidatus Hydrogenedentota bacterium]
VYQQRQIVAGTESLLPPLEAALQTTLHELAVLLGQEPRTELGMVLAALPEVGPLPEPGLPAELLARRPDIRAAGLRLRSADWRVSVARADRLPALRLTGSASYGADDWDLVFDNWAATLAAGVTGPIFDAGQRKAEVERARAVVDERLAAYRESVLIAAKEVETALFEEVKQVEYIEALNRELDAVRNAHEQALLRYRKGSNDYLPVVSAL